MLDRISQLYAEWKSLQPLKPEDQKRLDEKFRLEFNYNSNHIEGNTLTYGQTKLLLIFERTEGVHELREYEEMKAHDVALKMIIEEANDKERPLTENFIRTLNEIILVRPFWKDAETLDGQNTRMEVKVGEYKSRPNHVRTATNEIFHYATVEETPAMMKDLVDWFNSEVEKDELSPIELATLLHYRYIRIHPFEDGNGRIARLLVNYVLFLYDYPMIIIQTKDKNNYLRTLNRCDVEVGLEPIQGATAKLDKIQPFVEYVGEQLSHSLEIAIKAAKGENIEEDDDFEKKLNLIERELKRSGEVKISFSKEEVWKVLEFCYFPFTEKLTEKIRPMSKWFNYTPISNLISKTSDHIGGLHLNFIQQGNSQVDDFVRNAKSMHFIYKMQNPKDQKLNDFSYNIHISILFKEQGYEISSFDKKKYGYGQYPTQKELDEIISQYKHDVLRKLEAAIK